MILEC
jgi:hypothetical protein